MQIGELRVVAIAVEGLLRGPLDEDEHGYGAFFAGIDALVIGPGTYDSVLGLPETINIIPLILGAGRPLFTSGLPDMSLRLLEAKSFSSGVVQLRYGKR